MKAVVVSEFEAGSHRAHAINVAKTAGGFRRAGARVALLCRPAPPHTAHTAPAGDPADAYAEPDLDWRTAPADIPPAHEPGGSERFTDWAMRIIRDESPDLVYCRHFHAAIACAHERIPCVLETHAHIDDPNPHLQACFDLATDRGGLAAISTISSRLREHYVSRGAAPDRVHVTPDGVDIDLFTPPPGFEQPARERPLVLYAGHLYDYKGVPTLIRAAGLLPGCDVTLLGGFPEDIERARDVAESVGASNVDVPGPVPHAKVPGRLFDANALVLPPSAAHPSAAWTSPVKLGEYLAAGPPVAASRIPALLDWVDEPAVRWFAPDDPEDLARAIEECLAETPEHAQARRAHAGELARSFSYENRARALIASCCERRNTAV